MQVLAISLFALIFVFCLMTILLNSIEHDKMEIEKRVQGLVYVDDVQEQEKEEKKLRRRRREREDDGEKEKRQIELSANMKKRVQVVEEELYNLGLKISAKNFFIIWIGAVIVVPIFCMLIGMNMLVRLVAMGAAVVSPIIFIKRKKKKRREALEEQLVDAIGVLVNAMRAGYTFQSAISTIAEDMDDPIAEEFGRVFRETQRGITMEDSLNALVERIESDDLSIMCTAVNIQRQVGGNLSEVLEKISGTIRQRIALKGEIKTKTSSGRVSGYIVGGLPIIILLGVSVMNPTYTDILLNTSSGHILLIISAVLEGIGFAVIRKITTIKY